METLGPCRHRRRAKQALVGGIAKVEATVLSPRWV